MEITSAIENKSIDIIKTKSLFKEAALEFDKARINQTLLKKKGSDGNFFNKIPCKDTFTEKFNAMINRTYEAIWRPRENHELALITDKSINVNESNILTDEKTIQPIKRVFEDKFLEYDLPCSRLNVLKSNRLKFIFASEASSEISSQSQNLRQEEESRVRGFEEEITVIKTDSETSSLSSKKHEAESEIEESDLDISLSGISSFNKFSKKITMNKPRTYLRQPELTEIVDIPDIEELDFSISSSQISNECEEKSKLNSSNPTNKEILNDMKIVLVSEHSETKHVSDDENRISRILKKIHDITVLRIDYSFLPKFHYSDRFTQLVIDGDSIIFFNNPSILDPKSYQFEDIYKEAAKNIIRTYGSFTMHLLFVMFNNDSQNQRNDTESNWNGEVTTICESPEVLQTSVYSHKEFVTLITDWYIPKIYRKKQSNYTGELMYVWKNRK